MTDRPACNVQPGIPLTDWCTCGHRVGAHSPATGGHVCNVCVADDNKTLTTALRDIVNVLGPDQLCTCHNPDPDCGLRDEAAEALRIARAALGGDQ